MNIIGEVGINWNGSIDKAKKLIDIISLAGCDYVKFQKRDPDKCVPDHQKEKEKIVPWRKEPTTYLQYKKDIELNEEQYKELKLYCHDKKISMFSSAWDIDSAKFLKNFDYIVKIPSAKITDLELLDYCRDRFDQKILSTGMSTEQEIEEAVKILKPTIIMHTNSIYPTPSKDLNLGYIDWLQQKYSHTEIGYSSHFFGLLDSFVALGKGCTWLEKHVCESHNDWGSDQSSSIEPHGLFKLVKSIRELEGPNEKGNEKRWPYPGEDIKRDQLR